MYEIFALTTLESLFTKVSRTSIPRHTSICVSFEYNLFTFVLWPRALLSPLTPTVKLLLRWVELQPRKVDQLSILWLHFYAMKSHLTVLDSLDMLYQLNILSSYFAHGCSANTLLRLYNSLRLHNQI